MNEETGTFLRPAVENDTVDLSAAQNEAALVVVSGQHPDRIVRLDQSVLIGRGEEATIRIHDPLISRAHATITRVESQYVLTDLGSRNGTFVNGIATSKTALEFGDAISIGDDNLFLFVRYMGLGGMLAKRERLQTIGQLSAGIAHDINNLLTVVGGTTSYLSASLAPERADDSIRESFEDIATAVSRGADLVRQLLALAHGGELKIGLIDLAEIANNAIRLVERSFPTTIRVRASIQGSLHVHGAASEFHQLILNLLINARDAMPNGGDLSVTLAPAPLNTENRDGARLVRLVVADTGIGMDAATKARIFEPFFTTKQDRGTGLGLATVAAIIRERGGDITVVSEPGKGSSFEILLPEARVAPVVPSTLPPVASAQTSAGPVLILSADDLLARTAERLLVQIGYKTHVAPDEQAALDIMERLGLSLEAIFVDAAIVLHANAGKLVRAFRRDASVILFVGNDEAGALRELTRGYPHTIVEKPFTRNDLIRAMARAVAA